MKRTDPPVGPRAAEGPGAPDLPAADLGLDALWLRLQTQGDALLSAFAMTPRALGKAAVAALKPARATKPAKPAGPARPRNPSRRAR